MKNAIESVMRRDLSEAFVYFVLPAGKSMRGSSGILLGLLCN